MWKLAWRNLWRHRSRTLISFFAIALSLGMFLISAGMGDDSHRKMMDQAVRAAGGSVLVEGDAFWDHQSSDIYLTDATSVIQTAAALDQVDAVVPRILITGLVSSSHGDMGVRINAIDPALEHHIFDYAPYLTEGSFLDGPEDDPLVLGRGIVEELEVELGDRIVISTTDHDGEVTQALFHLSGVLDTGTGLDQTAALTSLAAARDAIGYDDDTVSQVGLVLHDDDERFAVQTALVAAMDRDDIEIIRWDEAIPDMIGFVKVDDAFNYLFMMMLFLVVAFGVANTFLMAVLERVRELGLLAAMGLTPKRIGQLVLLETLILGTLSVAVGFALGFGIHTYLQSHGIDVSQFYGSDESIDMAGVAIAEMTIRSTFNPAKWFTLTGGVFGIVMLSALYPALRASRMNPAQAMRTFQ